MRTQKRFYFSSILILTWLVLSSIVFVIANRVNYIQGFVFPNDLNLLGNFFHNLIPLFFVRDLFFSLGGVTFFCISALSLGLNVLRFQEPSFANGLIAFALGEVIYSLIFLIIISIFNLSLLITICILLAGFLFGLPFLKIWLRAISVPHFPTGFGIGEKLILGLLLLLLGLTTFLSSTRLGYDATAEYFSDAKIMAITGTRVFFYPVDSFVVSSFHPGILFTIIIQLFGDQSARLLSWSNGLAILLLGLIIAESLRISSKAKLWFLILMATSTFFIDLLGDGKVELIVTVPLLASIYCMINTEEYSSIRGFVIIGILMGFSIISRPYNFFLLPLFVIVFYFVPLLAWCRGSRLFRKTKNFYSSLFWGMALPLFILGIFHLWQNFLWLGNPIAPLIYAGKLNRTDWQWQIDPTWLNLIRFFYPLTVTVLNSPQSLGNISPLFIGFLPFLFLAEIRNAFEPSRIFRNTLIATFVSLGIWVVFFFTVLEIRYVMFLWVLLLLFAAQIIDISFQKVRREINLLLFGLAVLLVIFISVRILLVAFATYSPVDQTGQAQCPNFSLCTFFEPVNKIAASGDRVLAMHAYRYYLRKDLFACSSRSEVYVPLMDLAHTVPSMFWEAVYKQGFDYITFEYNFSVFHSRLGNLPATSAAPNWMQVVTLVTDGRNAIYKIVVANPPYKPDIECEINNNGVWQVQPKN